MKNQVISNKDVYGQTPAHELGHGAFGLKHTFDPEYGMSDHPQINRSLNLMGYNDKTHLAKFQWDIIHEHTGETEFESTEEVMARLIIIDEKHTKLFNQVYANNLNPYNAGAGSYQSEDWPAAWTYSDDKPEELVDKVIKKLRNTASGKMVDTIRLAGNRIYVGRHTVEGITYATAIYSRKAVIGGIKKVTVSDIKDLEKCTVIKQPLYCETAFANYLVIAFYEDGEDDPSLIIQAAKKGTIDVFHNTHLEAWMRYIGVMEENVLRCVTNSKDKAEHSGLPYCSDPLTEMSIQGTDKYNLSNKIGGLYGCTRSGAVSQCEEWSKNITNFPSIANKNKVHDGMDFTAPTGTPVYAMYKGIIRVGYSETMGYYVEITSTKSQHSLLFEDNTIIIWYGHLSSYESNLDGQIVEQGTLIGYTGNSGNIATKIEQWQYHLHLTVYVKNTSSKYNRVNPIKYIITKFNENGNKMP